MNIFQPSSGRVLLEVQEEDTSPISIASNEDTPNLKGKVVAIGEPLTTDFNATIHSPCKLGDIVLHTTIGYETIEIDYKQYKVVPFQNILGVLKNE